MSDPTPAAPVEKAWVDLSQVPFLPILLPAEMQTVRHMVRCGHCHTRLSARSLVKLSEALADHHAVHRAGVRHA